MAALAACKSSSFRFFSVFRARFLSKLPKFAFSLHPYEKVLNRGSFTSLNFTRTLFQSHSVLAGHEEGGEVPSEELNLVHPLERTLFVGKLMPTTTQESVKDYFSQFGVVEEVYLKASTKNYDLRSCAFVQFEDASSLEKVFSTNLEHVIDNRGVNVQKYAASNLTRIHVSDVPLELDESHLKEHFSQFGTINEVEFVANSSLVDRESYCFVEFTTPSAALKALASPWQQIGHHLVEVKKFTAKKQNYVKGKAVIHEVPDNITVEILRDYFNKFGDLVSIDMVFYEKKGRRKEMAFLVFSDDKSVERIAEKNGKHIIDNEEIIVERASSNLKSQDRDLKIFVDKIPGTVSELKVRKHFSNFGLAYLVKKWRSEENILSCIVKFNTRAEVDRVIAQTSHGLGGEKLIVKRIGWTAPPQDTQLKAMLTLL